MSTIDRVDAEGCRWNEDRIVDAAVAHLQKEEWILIYRTNAIGDGAIGASDAILMKSNPPRFCFVEGKGECVSKERRSLAATNMLGALLKRIKVALPGYLSNEAKHLFQPASQSEHYRALLQTHAVLANCQYVIAIPPEFRLTIASALEPALRAMLHIRVIVIADEVAEL